MRTRKPHWPTKSTLPREVPVQEHLLSERALRDRLEDITTDLEQRELLLAELDTAIRESRIS